MGYTVSATLAPDTGEVKVSDEIVLERGESAKYAAVYGAGNTQLVSFQKSGGSGAWITVASATMASSGDNFSGIYKNESPGQERVRFKNAQTATSTDESVTVSIVSYEGLEVSTDVAHVYSENSVSLQVTSSKSIFETAQVDVASLTNIAFHDKTVINDVAATNVTGFKAELTQGASGSVTGNGFGIDSVVHINVSGSADGALTPLHLAFESDSAVSDPAGADEVSYIIVENQGNATGGADIDTDAQFLHIVGHTIGAGNMVAAKTSAAVSHTLKVKIGSTQYYLMLSNAQ